MAEKRPIPPENPAVRAEPLRILRFPIRPAKGPYREGCSPRVLLAHKVLCTNNFLLIFMPFRSVPIFNSFRLLEFSAGRAAGGDPPTGGGSPNNRLLAETIIAIARKYCVFTCCVPRMTRHSRPGELSCTGGSFCRSRNPATPFAQDAPVSSCRRAQRLPGQGPPGRSGW